jgi:hypothetical protein
MDKRSLAGRLPARILSRDECPMPGIRYWQLAVLRECESRGEWPEWGDRVLSPVERLHRQVTLLRRQLAEQEERHRHELAELARAIARLERGRMRA